MVSTVMDPMATPGATITWRSEVARLVVVEQDLPYPEVAQPLLLKVNQHRTEPTLQLRADVDVAEGDWAMQTEEGTLSSTTAIRLKA